MQQTRQHSAERDQILKHIDVIAETEGLDSALVLVEPQLVTARVERDSTFLVGLLLRQGRLCVGQGKPRRAEEALHEGLEIAEALADTTEICAVLRWLGVAVEQLGRSAEAANHYHRLLAIARSAGDLDHEGWALIGLAWQARTAGRPEEAAGHYRRAAELLDTVSDQHGVAWALNGLSNAQRRIGDFDAASASLREAADAVRRGSPGTSQTLYLANILNDLGTLEFSLGDPGAARTHFQEAYGLHLQIGNERAKVIPSMNVAICQTGLGHYADAGARLEALAADCEERGYLNLLGTALRHLANLRNLQHRPNEAAELNRRVLALGDVMPARECADALTSLSQAIYQMDGSSAAIAVIEDGAPTLRGAGDIEVELRLRRHLGAMHFLAGHYEEALEHLSYVNREENRLGLTRNRIMALTLAAQACRALGMQDSAKTLLQEAAEVWETDRTVPLDPEWREQRGGQNRRLCTQFASLLLSYPPETPETDRIRAAYDRTQRFKARTLLERMHGPGRALDSAYRSELPPPATVEKLQQEVLEDDEILLDALVGPVESFLFAVTREECRVVHLPSEDELAGKLRLFSRWLSAPSRSDASVDDELASEIAGGVSKLITGPLSDLIASSDRLLFAPDGVLNLLPLAALPDPGQPRDSSHAGGDPMISRKDVVRIPSATFLAWRRGIEQQPAAGDGLRILAAAAGRTDAGEALPGAIDEVRRLRERYRGVDCITISSDSRPVSIPDTLADYDLLHLAAHARAEDQSPWRSTIRFSTVDEGCNPRADRIAAMRLTAKLAVLSSCESARGPILSGEGVQGLSSAFLSAGVPTIVATLWAVDDRSSAQLMEQFYEQLADGKTVAGALRIAQNRLRQAERTRHPYFWAGFVLIGDGQIRVDLDRRVPINCKLIVVLAVLGVVVALAWMGWARRGRTDRRA